MLIVAAVNLMHTTTDCKKKLSKLEFLLKNVFDTKSKNRFIWKFRLKIPIIFTTFLINVNDEKTC